MNFSKNSFNSNTDFDTIVDLVVADSYYHSLRFFLDHGDETFPNYTSYSFGFHPIFILSADFNNDGRIDLAAANGFGANTVIILFGIGNGTFTNETMCTTGIFPNYLTAGAFRDKTKLDLVVANNCDNDVSFFFNSCQ